MSYETISIISFFTEVKETRNPVEKYSNHLFLLKKSTYLVKFVKKNRIMKTFIRDKDI